jgi:diguanylate cyclase (GGDEF)-like protein
MVFMGSKYLLKKYKNILTFFFALFITISLSLLQYKSGPELIFSLFYVFPIILLSWKVGIWSGIIISFLSSSLMLYADKKAPYQYSSFIIPYLNNLFRLIIFLIITYIISELKIALDRQKDLARIDPLTSIPNSRAFNEAADMEFQKSRRYGFPISVIYMDLDNFKEVNDTLGHSTGDTLLKLTAVAIVKNIRTIDIAARLGGDEFGILLSQTGSESAYIVANKLKEMMNNLMNKYNWPVTLSIGVVTFLKAPESVDEMMNKADHLMYSAKFDGKNNIKQSVIS